jgi:ABC-type phosphate/phosphonate transport system substrate-binding protein
VTAALVTLPMYDLPELRPATRALAGALAAAVGALGWPAAAADTAFTTHLDLEDHWRSAGGAVAVTQACGLPLVETLAGRLEALGTFLWRGISRPNGWYRSVVVVRSTATDDLHRVTPAVNHPQSLSGWASLGWALVERGVTPEDLATVVVTGSHVASLVAVADGVADVASIDAATYALLARVRPALVSQTRVLVHGPWVPATPLVTGVGAPVDVEGLRTALSEAVAAPALAGARDALGIEGFVPIETATYDRPVRAVVDAAERILPRAGTHLMAR